MTEHCPTCGQNITRYKRTIHHEMVTFMQRLLKCGGMNKPIHVREISPQSRKSSTDASYLTLWGMVTKRGRGEYLLTNAGRDFIYGRCSAPRYAYVKCGQLEGFSESDRIRISDVIGFDSKDLF